ncbi:MAG: hypothetical protein WKG00_35520 [Polyangiaceae bacterium]
MLSRPARCALLFALVVAGCDDEVIIGPRVQRCLDACEEGRSCPDSDDTYDCFTVCDDLDAVNRASDCWRTYDALYDCMDVHGVCGSSETCASQQAAYGDCIAENCSTDPDRDECAL